MKKSLIFGVALAAVCGAGGFVWGQNKPDENDPDWKFGRELVVANRELEGSIGEPLDGAKRLSNAYNQVSKEPKWTHNITEQAIIGAYGDKPQASMMKLLALQCSQNARIIEQNDQLLAALKNKK